MGLNNNKVMIKPKILNQKFKKIIQKPINKYRKKMVLDNRTTFIRIENIPTELRDENILVSHFKVKIFNLIIFFIFLLEFWSNY